MFGEAPKDWISRVYVTESLTADESLMKQVMELPEEKREIVADNVFRQMCDTRTPQGILTVLKKPAWTVEDILKGDAPLVMVLEGLQDPGNAGTIFRTGEGAGVSGVWRIVLSVCGDAAGNRAIDRRLKEIIKETESMLRQRPEVMERLYRESRGTARLAYYMNRYGGYPIWENTSAQYFPLGDDMYPVLLEELRKAERYIFMEYFIVEKGEMWDSILEILKEKAAAGVEVRFMYDGMCCLTLMPYGYPKQLEKYGIHCKMFSPVRPVLSSYQNNRDHRKITVIDGHTAFTGGVNLADEYINRKVRFGHWKDTAIMLKGDAATGFLMMFLQMWNITEHRTDDYAQYLYRPAASNPKEPDGTGFVMPYGDSPLDNETVGQHVYMDILNESRYYVHIMTPYLILDSDMILH